jgi:hypothetical protein
MFLFFSLLILFSMKTERVWMVQTEQQYICIHQCLMAVLEGKENSGPPREIHDNQGYEGKFIGSWFSNIEKFSEKSILQSYFNIQS